jgi:hypothetical protein
VWFAFPTPYALRPTPYALHDNAVTGPAKFVASLTIFATILALANKLDDMIKVEEQGKKDQQQDNATEDKKELLCAMTSERECVAELNINPLSRGAQDQVQSQAAGALQQAQKKPAPAAAKLPAEDSKEKDKTSKKDKEGSRKKKDKTSRLRKVSSSHRRLCLCLLFLSCSNANAISHR